MRTIEVSHRTIVFSVVLLLGLWFLWQIREVIVLLFVSFLIATALKPVVDRLVRFRLPRGIALVLVYIVLLGGIVGVIASIIPPLIEQTTALASRLPGYLESLGIEGIDERAVGNQLANLGEIPANIFRFATSVFSNLLTVFAVLMFTFYMLVERGNLDRRLSHLFGQDQERVAAFLNQLEMQLGGWVRGELILMTIIGVLTYIGLRLLNIQYALPLALLAGILEVVPNLGPLVAAIPAVIVGFTISPVLGLAVAALYFLIQQLENSVIVPKVMERSVGVSPLIILMALGIGFQLNGVLGAILAVPVMIVIRVIVKEFTVKLNIL